MFLFNPTGPLVPPCLPVKSPCSWRRLLVGDYGGSTAMTFAFFKPVFRMPIKRIIAAKSKLTINITKYSFRIFSLEINYLEILTSKNQDEIKRIYKNSRSESAMSSDHNPLWPWSPIVATLVILNTTYPLQAFEDDWRERRMETPIGFEDSSDYERAIGFARDENHSRVEVNSIYGSTLASAIGNQINVEAGAGSSVVINGDQINKGSQFAVTVIGDDYEDIVDEAREDFERRR